MDNYVPTTEEVIEALETGSFDRIGYGRFRMTRAELLRWLEWERESAFLDGRIAEREALVKERDEALAAHAHDMDRLVEFTEARTDAEADLAAALAVIEKVRAYADDRAYHARGHLNTVNSGRIAADLHAILSSFSAGAEATE
jgi:hypothetical protein